MKKIPFDFVLDCFSGLDLQIKPMFGCHALYVGHKIVFILRNRNDHPEDNGIWIATSKKHHQALKSEFPSMRSIKCLGKGTTNWQVLPVLSDDFEESAIRACELFLMNDERIGKIPGT